MTTWHLSLFFLSYNETAALGFTCPVLLSTLLAIIFYIFIGFFPSHLFSNTLITLRIYRFSLRKSISTVQFDSLFTPIIRVHIEGQAKFVIT
jgi:hypothetical protein